MSGAGAGCHAGIVRSAGLMSSPLGIALLGAGTVGAAVARVLVGHPDRLAARSGGPLALLCVAERDEERRRRLDLPGVTLLDDAAAALEVPGVEIAVEVMGGLEPAGSVLDAALRRGLGAVTANKALIASRGHDLAGQVQAASGGLAFEAAVGAAIPVLAALRDSLGGDAVEAITAVINGTTTYVLGRLEAGASLDEAVREAQRNGFAEADPSADLDGHDAAQKLCILAWFGLHAQVAPEQVARTGIRAVTPQAAASAARAGAAVRLVAAARRVPGGLSLRVQPLGVPREHPLGGLEGADNAVVVESDLAGTLVLRGRGAGAEAAASAVLGDIAQVALARRQGRRIPLPQAAALPVLTGPPPEGLSPLDGPGRVP